MNDGLTDTQRAFLASREHAADFEDMSAQDINRMSMADYGRLTGRQTIGEIAPSAPPAPTTQQAPAPAQRPTRAPEGIAPGSAEYFHAWRAQRARGGEGVGIFDSVDSRSSAYAAAVRAQAGRGALSNSNVIEAPQLTGRYPHHDALRDTRTAAQRFSTPGNAFS
jgi:hypothetical protein